MKTSFSLAFTVRGRTGTSPAPCLFVPGRCHMCLSVTALTSETEALSRLRRAESQQKGSRLASGKAIL